MIDRLVELGLFLGLVVSTAPHVLDWSDRRAEARRQHHIPAEFYRGYGSASVRPQPISVSRCASPEIPQAAIGPRP